MADEFDAFEKDFENPEDFETVSGAEEKERKKEKTNPIKIVINFITHLSKKVLILTGVGVIALIIIFILLGSFVQQGNYGKAIENPYHYGPLKYRFKLDEDIIKGTQVYEARVLLKLEAVFDKDFKDFGKILDAACIQIQDKIQETIISRLTYKEVGINEDSKKDNINIPENRANIYKEIENYLKLIIGKRIQIEILEIQFDLQLIPRRY